MREKKVGIALVFLLVMAVVLSVKAHAADSPQTVISTNGDKTSISITDITPREDEKDEKNTQKNYTVGSYYPIEVQTAEDHGMQLLVKTFVVPEGTDPQTLIEGDLTRRGISYEVSDILCQELPGDMERKTVSQTLTMDSETDKLENILPLLKSSMEYQEGGFSGTLTLDKSSIQVKESGTSNYSYQLKETKEYTGLDRNDPYYIPKTTEKNGVTLNLADIEWTPMASAAENSDVPSLYRATAIYTGTAWGSKADGYTVTADYTGEVSRTIQGDMKYSIIYEEIQQKENQQENTPTAFPWKTIVLVVIGIGIIGSGAFGIFWMVATHPRKKRRPTVTTQKVQLKMADKSMEAAL